jgi:hypothetical protein
MQIKDQKAKTRISYHKISKNKEKNRDERLFLYLLMDGLFFAEFAKLIELNFSLNEFFVLSGPIINVFTFLTAEFD